MIHLTRLNGTELYLNADLVATVESHHDTVVTLVDGKTFVVAESAREVVRSVTLYRASVLALADSLSDSEFGADELPADVGLVDGPTAPVVLLRPGRTAGEH